MFADTNGTRLHYVTGGDGPAVVLLHGYPYTWEVWKPLLPLLVEAGYTVIAPDLRGLGFSDRPNAGYDKASVAEDVRGIVLSLGIDRIHLVGTDIGAMVAYAYASRHPDEVERFVFAESLIPGFGLEELMNPATGGYWHFGFHAQVEVATMLTAGKEGEYLMPWYGMMSAAPSAAETAARSYLPFYQARGSMRAGFRHYETLVADGRANREQLVDPLPMPTLVLSGERGIPQAQTLACVSMDLAAGFPKALVVNKLMAQEHEVVAVSRSPAPARTPASRFAARTGDLTDVAFLRTAIEGCDAVISCLGQTRASKSLFAKRTSPPDILYRVAAATIAAIGDGPQQFIYMSAFGVGDDLRRHALFFRIILRLSSIHDAYLDHARAEAAIRASNVRWTIVRPQGLTDKDEEILLVDKSDRWSSFESASKKSVAAYLVTCAERRGPLGATITIGKP